MLDGAEARLAVDIGGTFTDIVLQVGQVRRTRKVLTTPVRPEQVGQQPPGPPPEQRGHPGGELVRFLGGDAAPGVRRHPATFSPAASLSPAPSRPPSPFPAAPLIRSR